MAARYTLLGELQHVARAVLRRPAPDGELSPPDTPATLPYVQAPGSGGASWRRLRRYTRLTALWCAALFAAIWAIGALTYAVHANDDWAVCVAAAGFFGGLALVLFGFGRPKGKALWVVTGAVGGVGLMVASAPFVPSKHEDLHAAAKATPSLVAEPLLASAEPTSKPPRPTANVSAPTATVSATNVPTPTTVVSSTNVPSPTANVSATPSSPAALAVRAEQSIRDNRNAVTEGASLDNLRVGFDESTSLLRLSILPNKPKKESQFLTNGSALVVIAARAIWTTYPEVSRIAVEVRRNVRDERGNDHEEQVAVVNFSRENAATFEWLNLRGQPAKDNKKLFCLADFYAMQQFVWAKLENKGCLTGRSGGNDANPEEQALALQVFDARPQTLEQRIEKSIRDNKNAVSKGANLDNLGIKFEPTAGLLTLSIRPNSPDGDSQFITNGSAMAIISGKAIWTTYGQVERISVQVFRGTKVDPGNLLSEQMAVADFARANGLKQNYDSLKNQPADDNKRMYCAADFYAISVRMWDALKEKGCLQARLGGPNPTADQQFFVNTLPTTVPTSEPTARSTSTQTSTSTPKPTATPKVPVYKLSVSTLSCRDDGIGDRVCTGVVTNIQPDKNATDIGPIIHWVGGTDSSFGSVDINPLLPGQSSPFTVYTLHPNPLLTKYTIGFSKLFGNESDYPIQPR